MIAERQTFSGLASSHSSSVHLGPSRNFICKKGSSALPSRRSYRARNPQLSAINTARKDGGPVQSLNQDHDRDHDRNRVHVPAQDLAVIARAHAHHGAVHPVAGAFVLRINIAGNGSLFPKIEVNRNLDRAPDREADKCGFNLTFIGFL